MPGFRLPPRVTRHAKDGGANGRPAAPEGSIMAVNPFRRRHVFPFCGALIRRGKGMPRGRTRVCIYVSGQLSAARRNSGASLCFPSTDIRAEGRHRARRRNSIDRSFSASSGEPACGFGFPRELNRWNRDTARDSHNVHNHDLDVNHVDSTQALHDVNVILITEGLARRRPGEDLICILVDARGGMYRK